MVPAQLGEVVQRVRDVLARPHSAGPADADLWALYVQKRDEDAFAALVRRHGPMVLSVCRRILRTGQRCCQDRYHHKSAFHICDLISGQCSSRVSSRELRADDCAHFLPVWRYRRAAQHVSTLRLQGLHWDPIHPCRKIKRWIGDTNRVGNWQEPE